MKVLLLICLFFWVGMLKAAPLPIILDQKMEIVQVLPALELLEDKAASLDLKKLLESDMEFADDWRDPISIGYTLSAWWVRFDVLNHDPNNRYWYLQLQNINAHSLQVYVFPKGLKARAHILPAIHQLRHASFRLELPQSVQYSVYLRIKTPNRPLVFNLRLLSADALVKATPTDHIFYAFMLGGLLIMSVYNLLTFFNLKELSYLSLTIFIFSNFLGLSSQSGMLSLIFPPIPTDYIHVVFAMLSIASGNRFFYYLMSISQRLPFWANLFKIHFWLSSLVTVLIYFMPFQLFYPSFFGLALLLLMIPVLWILYRDQVPEAKGFLWAFVVIFVSCIPILLFGLGFLHEDAVPLKILMLGFLLFVVLLSLSQSMRTRELREQAQQIEASSKAKDAFLMIMSHELRTPMHAVVSSGTLLQQTKLTAQQSDYVAKLQASAGHMLSLINNILDVSRLNHTKADVKNQVFTLQAIVENLEKLLSDQAREKGLEFILNSEYSITLPLLDDPIRLSQILLNLLDNAVKFTDEGLVNLTIKPMGQWLNRVELQFTVTDTGIGLSLKEQERLFEPFFQVNSSISRRYRGTGLGLTISYDLVKQLGGELQVRSKPAQGSAFFFKLMFTLAEQQPISHFIQPLTIRNYQEKRVLLVDDDSLNQFFGKELLMVLGVQVDLAESGAVALVQLKEVRYDLVFMDVSMPDLDGYQTTQLIRHELQLTELPIVALTAHAIFGEHERCLAAGMNDYLAKPFSIQELEIMLARWLIKNDN